MPAATIRTSPAIAQKALPVIALPPIMPRPWPIQSSPTIVSRTLTSSLGRDTSAGSLVAEVDHAVLESVRLGQAERPSHRAGRVVGRPGAEQHGMDHQVIGVDQILL